MSDPRTDPLLSFTRTALWVTLVISIIVAGGLAIAIPGIWVFGDTILAKAALEGVKLAKPESLAAISANMFGSLIVVGMAIQFLRKLIALIDSVGAGSPFIPENAARLRYMGWIVLAMQSLAVFNWHIVFSFSFEGLITALLLFILASVFEHGMRLEQDVEGTV